MLSTNRKKLPPLTLTDDERRQISLTLQFLAAHMVLRGTHDDEGVAADMEHMIYALAEELDPEPDYDDETIERYGLAATWVDSLHEVLP